MIKLELIPEVSALSDVSVQSVGGSRLGFQGPAVQVPKAETNIPRKVKSRLSGVREG